MHAIWVIPPVGEASGGMRTIVQAINALVAYGHDCAIIVDEPYRKPMAFESSERLLRTEYALSDRVEVLDSLDGEKPKDCLVATMWSTVDFVRREHAQHKVYFVQDFEPWFYSMGDEYLNALSTYGYGLRVLTIGRWLAHKIEHEFDSETSYFDFCADKRIYHYDKRSQKRAICAVYQPEKPRRCEAVLISALRIVKHFDPSLQIYLFGSSALGSEEIDFECENLGVISVEDCNDLYNICQLGVCCSSSNPSRIPFEMMASGLPVVDLYGENTAYDYPDDAVLLAQPNPEALATAILKLAHQPDLRKKASLVGLEFMAERNLGRETAEIVEFFNNLNEKTNCITAEEARQVPKRKSAGVAPSKDVLEYALEINRERAEQLKASWEVLEGEYFEVRITCSTGFALLRQVRAAVWCANDQSDIVWYDATMVENSVFLVRMSCRNHQCHSGLYKIHIYGDLKNGEDQTFLGGIEKEIRCSCSNTPPEPDGEPEREETPKRIPPIAINVEVSTLTTIDGERQ